MHNREHALNKHSHCWKGNQG